MLLSRAAVSALTEERLIEFIALDADEGAQLDFKSNLSGGVISDPAKKEFLKDITAFANSVGGLLVLGVHEPREGMTATDRLVGVNDGIEVARQLEAVARTSIDPPIPGILVQPVQLQSGSAAIVVLVPQSQVRPHMVSYKGHRTFYIRHTESSPPMSTHEIRDAVLSASSDRVRAEDYCDKMLLGSPATVIGGRPALVLQAIPISPLPTPWDTNRHEFLEVVRGHRREELMSRDEPSFHLTQSPRPTIDGIRGADRNSPPLWVTEIHRTGYIHVVYIFPPHPSEQSGGAPAIFASHATGAFKAFTEFCRECLDAGDSDIAMLVRSNALNVFRSVLMEGRYVVGEPCDRGSLTWPDQVRLPGDDFAALRPNWKLLLHNAFGHLQ